MTKKTRIRVARIAAGAVIAAGASLTAAGAASALEINLTAGVGVATDGEPDPCDISVDPDCQPSTPPSTPSQPSTPPSTPSQPSTPPSTPSQPSTPPSTPSQPTDPGQPSTPGNNGGGSGNPGGGNGNPGGGNGNNGGGSGTNGGGGTDVNGGGNDNSAQEAGTSALTDTGADTPANPSAQGNGEELAETGAGQTAFLLVGAATMIAGGIGFRVLPRMMGGRGGAAA